MEIGIRDVHGACSSQSDWSPDATGQADPLHPGQTAGGAAGLSQAGPIYTAWSSQPMLSPILGCALANPKTLSPNLGLVSRAWDDVDLRYGEVCGIQVTKK